jgi:hypothetical protein
LEKIYTIKFKKTTTLMSFANLRIGEVKSEFHTLQFIVKKAKHFFKIFYSFKKILNKVHFLVNFSYYIIYYSFPKYVFQNNFINKQGHQYEGQSFMRKNQKKIRNQTKPKIN